MNHSNDREEHHASSRNHVDTSNSNPGPSVFHNEIQSGSDSEVTRHIKDSISRSQQNMAGESIEDKVRQLTEITSNLIDEMPVVASRTIQIMNKIVSVGKARINSINDIRNSVSLDKNR